jgi:hypothetical protein
MTRYFLVLSVRKINGNPDFCSGRASGEKLAKLGVCAAKLMKIAPLICDLLEWPSSDFFRYREGGITGQYLIRKNSDLWLQIRHG